MEGNRLFDVPITEKEHTRHNDTAQLLPPDSINDIRYTEEQDVVSDRSKPPQASIQQAYDSAYTSRSHITHQHESSNSSDEQQRRVNFDQPTSYTRQATYSRLDYPPDLWRPFWVRTSTLVVLLFLFLLITVGLVLLWYFSHHVNGFEISSSTSYYAWRLAPLALMVIIISVWRQVDYYVKILAPWDELRKGPIPASQSLLLDYVSPLNILSLFTAFKQGYIPVILSILVFIILKLIVIFSAALLVPLPTVIESNSTSAFSAKAFDASSFNTSGFPNVPPFSSDPVYSTLGNIAYGLPYGSGVRSEYAYIPVDLRSDYVTGKKNAIYVAETEVLFPNLACVPLQVQMVGNTTIMANRTTANTTSNYITLQIPDGSVCQSWNRARVNAMNPQTEKTPPRQLEGTMQRVYCANNQTVGSQILEPAGLLFTMTDIRYTQIILSNGTIANSTRSLATMANVLCIPGYYMLKANISNNSALFGVNAVDIEIKEIENKTLTGLSAANLAVLYDGVLNASRGIFGTRQDNTQALTIPSTVFNLMALASNQSSTQSFLDPKTMSAAAENIFRRVMSHYAAQSLTTPVETDILAQTTYTTEKLHMSLIPFCIILAGTALSAFFTALLCVVMPGPIVPKDPSLIAMSAAVLARSPELNRLLRNQISGKTAMSHLMSGHEFSSAIATSEIGQTSYKLVVTEVESKPPTSRMSPWTWWSPHTLLLPAFALAVTISSALIGVLQYLQHRSDTNHGLTTLTIGPYTTLCFVCIPVLVVLLIAEAVEYLDFYVELLSPWNKLAEGDSNPKRSLLSQLLGKLPPFAFVEALRKAHFGAIFSIPAAVLASVFVIIASGLYHTESAIVSGVPQQISTNNTFQFQNRYSVLSDNGAAGILRLVDSQERSYPSGTFEDLVFPEYLAQNTSKSPRDISSGPSSAIVPAFRASLKCDIVADSSILTTYLPASSTYNSNRYQVDSIYYLPAGCQYGGMYRNSSVARFRNLFNVTNNSTVIYGGQLLDLVFGQNSSLVANYGETRAATIGNNPAVGCPSLAFTYAQITGNGQKPQLTSLVCYQQIEQLRANITYKPNSTELDPYYPPVVVDSPVSLVTNPNATSNIKSFDWRIQRNIEAQLYGLDGARLRSANFSSTYQFDAFFSYLLNNTLKQDPVTWTGGSNQQTLTTAINNLYSKYMAQAINGNMRIITTSATNANRKRQSAASSTTMATYTVESRLVQDYKSKLALQILLGISVLFSILAYLFTSFHCLLPCNPSSIAGTMSLLAGSDLCWSPEDALCDCCGKPRRSSWNHEQTERDEIIDPDPSNYHIPTATGPRFSSRRQIIPYGAEWLDYLKFAAVFAGRSYSLGWWKEDRAKARRRRFGVDVGAKPDGEHDDDWELGDRRPLGEQGFEGLMMKGRGMLGDQRGQYQRAENGDVIISAPMPSLRPGYEHQYEGVTPSIMQGVTSPRKVRFEDDV